MVLVPSFLVRCTSQLTNHMARYHRPILEKSFQAEEQKRANTSTTPDATFEFDESQFLGSSTPTPSTSGGRTQKRISDFYSCIKISKTSFFGNIMRFVCENGLAFKVFDSEAMQSSFAEQARTFKFTLGRQQVRDFIVDQARLYREKVKEELKGKVVYLLVDGASRQFRSFLGINVVFYHNMKTRLYTLACMSTKNSTNLLIWRSFSVQL